MPRLDLVAGGAGDAAPDAFEIALVDGVDSAAELRLPLVEACPVPFEACRPVREFPS